MGRGVGVSGRAVNVSGRSQTIGVPDAIPDSVVTAGDDPEVSDSEEFDTSDNTTQLINSLNNKVRGPVVTYVSGFGWVSAGGRDSNNAEIANVEYLNKVSGTWDDSKIPNMPNKRWEAAGCTHKGYAVIAGGFDGISANKDLDYLDVESLTWATSSALPNGINQCACGEDGDFVYAAGGINDSDGFQRWDLSSDSWDTSITDVPYSQQFGHLAGFNNKNKLVLCGGTSGGSTTDLTYIYDADTDSWTQGQSMNTAAERGGELIRGNKMYVVGGETDKIQEYDIDADDWTTVASLSESRAYVGAG